jgi:hypothetical protein
VEIYFNISIIANNQRIKNISLSQLIGKNNIQKLYRKRLQGEENMQLALMHKKEYRISQKSYKRKE